MRTKFVSCRSLCQLCFPERRWTFFGPGDEEKMVLELNQQTRWEVKHHSKKHDASLPREDIKCSDFQARCPETC